MAHHKFHHILSATANYKSRPNPKFWRREAFSQGEKLQISINGDTDTSWDGKLRTFPICSRKKNSKYANTHISIENNIAVYLEM